MPSGWKRLFPAGNWRCSKQTSASNPARSLLCNSARTRLLGPEAAREVTQMMAVDRTSRAESSALAKSESESDARLATALMPSRSRLTPILTWKASDSVRPDRPLRVTYKVKRTVETPALPARFLPRSCAAACVMCVRRSEQALPLAGLIAAVNRTLLLV